MPKKCGDYINNLELKNPLCYMYGILFHKHLGKVRWNVSILSYTIQYVQHVVSIQLFLVSPLRLSHNIWTIIHY